MSLDFFIDIRFADPVLALSMNNYGLIYGSSIGRILFYTFHSQQEIVLAEFSEECIRGVFVSKENNLYISVGDRYCISMTSPTSHKQLIHHDFPHSDDMCLSTQVFMKEELVCVMPLSENNTEGLIITHISTHTKKKYPMLPFKQHTVPYDFDGDRLLWMEWAGKDRVFKYFDFVAAETKDIRVFPKNYGQIGFCKLVQDCLVIVKDFRTIELIDLATTVLRQVIGTHYSDIVALNWVKVKSKTMQRENQYKAENSNDEKILFISIDYNCNICVWDKQGMICSHNITEFTELTEEYRQQFYFTMGYPYYLCVFDKRIAFSTDVGVLVVTLPVLTQVVVINE